MNEIKKLVFGALILMVTSYSQLATAAKLNPPLFPIDSYPYGKSYGVWGQEFSKWLYQFSLAEFPLLQGDGPTDCGVAQSGQVRFLYGILDGTAERSCTIPPGKAIFISVNSVISFVPLFGENEQEIREDAKRDLDGTAITQGVETLEVIIDGTALDDPFGYRASSPEGGFVLTVSEGSVLAELGIPDDDYDPAIVDGYWVMLPPLSAGAHTIEWSSSGQNQFGETYSYTAIWHIDASNK